MSINSPDSEQPHRMSMQRDSHVSGIHKDHEVEFFRHVAVLKRHLKPLSRFLLSQVGKPWSSVAPEIEHRCRQIKAPQEIKTQLSQLVRRQCGLGGDGIPSVLFPRVVYVDETGIIQHGDKLKK